MKEASLTEDPALPQNAEPVALGGKNDVFALGISCIKKKVLQYFSQAGNVCDTHSDTQPMIQ